MVKRSIKAVSRGFTLIELLVVIAIIGLLAAVVLASVGSARNKGVDASVKSELDGMRSQAELYASNNGNSYASACTTAGSSNGLKDMAAGAAGSTGATVVSYANVSGGTTAVQAAGTVVCGDYSSYWVVQAPLSAATGGYWCVDNTGASKSEAAVLAAGSKACL